MKSIWKRSIAGLSIRDPRTGAGGAICWVSAAGRLDCSETGREKGRRHAGRHADTQQPVQRVQRRAKLGEVLSVRGEFGAGVVVSVEVR
jgi:hypothetical protein